jgi:hypothetical protein
MISASKARAPTSCARSGSCKHKERRFPNRRTNPKAVCKPPLLEAPPYSPK